MAEKNDAAKNADPESGGLTEAAIERLGLSDYLVNWARKGSLWWLSFGLACCAIEQIHAVFSRYDFERLGVIPRATPRQADVLIVSGWVAKKSVPLLRTLYEQMPEPKYVISMGDCANTGGVHAEALMTVRGVDQFLPVDVYIPGCPPRPEVLLGAFIKLQEKIASSPAPRRGRPQVRPQVKGAPPKPSRER